jgi:hypothetical protein
LIEFGSARVQSFIMRVWCEILGNACRPGRDYANEGVSDG